MAAFVKRLMPREDKFFEMFEAHAQTAHVAAAHWQMDR